MNKHIFKIGIKYYGSEDYEYTEVTPHYKELTKKYDKESQQEFFRETIDGDIKLVGTDFDLVANSYLEAELVFEIYTNGVLNYKGTFSKTDCELDYSKKICKLKTTPLDNYTQILEKYDNTYDLIKLAPALTSVDLTKRPLLQVYVTGANTISNFIGGIYYETEVTEAIDNENALIDNLNFSLVSSANEFEITGAFIAGANGLYAGQNGLWKNNNGYTCYAEKDISTYTIFIKNSQNVVLYSSSPGAVAFPSSDDLYFENGKTLQLRHLTNVSDFANLSETVAYRVFQRMLCDIPKVQNINCVPVTSNDFAASSNYNYTFSAFEQGIFLCTAYVVDEPTIYGKNDFGKYFTSDFLGNITYVGRKPLPISHNSWVNSSLWYVYDINYNYLEKLARKQYTLKDAYHISDVIKALLKEIGSTVIHENTSEYSQFLYSASNRPIIEDTELSSNLILDMFWGDSTRKYEGEVFVKYLQNNETTGRVMFILADADDNLLSGYYVSADNFLTGVHTVYMRAYSGFYCYATINFDFIDKTAGSGYTPEPLIRIDCSKIPTKANSTVNPVLGTQFEVFLTQKTNVLKGEYDLAAQKAEASLEDLMKMLRDCYRCYWFVEDGKFKIEHISYFMNGGRYSGSPIVQLDLTTETDRFNGKQADFMQSAVRFEKSELAARYEFGWTDDSTELFTGLTIDILSNYIQKDKTEDITINQFSADIDYMLLNPSNFTEDGFALLCPIYENNKYIVPIVEYSNLKGENTNLIVFIQNFYASWIYMVQSYMWDMPAAEVESNMLEILTTKGIKNCMQQEIQFFADNLKPYELITTSLGDGRIDSLEVNIDTNVTKANLLFPPR